MRAARTLIALGLIGALFGSVAADAELTQQGDLVVAFEGGLVPKTLPRQEEVPVAVRVAGDVRDAAGGAGKVPQLRTISVAINRAGRLFDKGLPVCVPASIQPATEAGARETCGNAIVGSGHVTVQVRLPSQPSFAVRGRLLAFNGPRQGGRKLILAQVYSRTPPGSFVLPFVVRKRAGLFGTTMTTTLPRSARGWAYLTHFDMTLKRVYSFAGQRRSFISAACRAPAGFPGAVFPFAKAIYGFGNGQRLTTTVVRSCRVAAD
jgi:hypothetical protein